MRTPKAVPIVLRGSGEALEVLVFAHPQAGVQVVKGTVEPGESVNEAASRELAEESGVVDARCARDLGTWEQCPSGQVWYFREMSVHQRLPESWEHFTSDGGGHTFRFSWHRLSGPPPAACHPVFVAALAFLRAQVSALSAHSPHSVGGGAA